MKRKFKNLIISIVLALFVVPIFIWNNNVNSNNIIEFNNLYGNNNYEIFRYEQANMNSVTYKNLNNIENRESRFGVGSGIKWPDKYFAPFVDITAWTRNDAYSNNGVLDVAKVQRETGINYFNLGFINYNPNTVTRIGKYGKMVDWCFGGYPVLSEYSNDQWQYQGIKDAIKKVREQGGDVTISIGGAKEQNFFQRTQDIDILVNTYMDVITGYGLTRLDLDIECNAQTKYLHIANAKALKKLQSIIPIDIVLTLPVEPRGITNTTLGVLDAYIEENVEISKVNLMTMCYGIDCCNFNESYGQAAIRAVENAKNQLKQRYENFTENQIYNMLGTTLSIGYESSNYPIFTVDWAEEMYQYAVNNGLGMLSFWCVNRDAMLVNNSGIDSKYQYANVYNNFANNIEVNIDFNTNGGSYIASINEQVNKNISKPTNPTKNGYVFAGWFSDENLVNEFVFNKMPNENMVVYAKWEKLTGYKTITYIIDENKMNVINIENKINIVKPSKPIREGYEFAGWFIDKEFTNEFNFNKMPDEDVKVYAKWAKIKTNNENTTNDNINNDKNIINEPKGYDYTGFIVGGAFSGFVLLSICVIFFKSKKA